MHESEPNWDALIRNCFSHPGDEATLGHFFGALLPYLSAALLATYSRDRETVQDALQSAFIKYMSIFKKGQEGRELSIGYFVVIARNCLIDELRRRKGQVPIDEIAESDLPSVPASDMDEGDTRMVLLQYAMMRLDPRCQFILESYYIDEMDVVKLADWLGIASDSVHMAIKRCRDRLRSMLTESKMVTTEAGEPEKSH